MVNLLSLGRGQADHRLPLGPRFRSAGPFPGDGDPRRGLVKKTPLQQYSRPLRSGIIAIKLREGDALVDVVVTKPGDELVLSTARGMAIRFKESDARPMGRNSSGVKGIRLLGDDGVVGMVVADPEASLLTVCANGYGKRTPFGPNLDVEPGGRAADTAGTKRPDEGRPPPTGRVEEPSRRAKRRRRRRGISSQRSYRTQRHGGKGLRDIKTTERNGPVIGAGAHVRRRRVADDYGAGKFSGSAGRHQHYRPQHAGREDHEPRRGGRPGGGEAGSAGRERGEGGGRGRVGQSLRAREVRSPATFFHPIFSNKEPSR